MIEDKEHKTLFAESEEEAGWFRVSDDLKQTISILKMRIAKAEKDLKLSARKIEQKFKNGARALIKANKQSIKINKEFLKLAESNLNRKI